MEPQAAGAGGARTNATVKANANAKANAYSVSIPAAYTDSPFALQYYFVLQESPTEVHLFPGLGASLTQMPYFVVEQVTDGRPGSPTRRSG